MKILLIHGYGVGIKSILNSDLTLTGGFGAFEELILKKKATVFRWDIPYDFTLIQTLNPLNHLQVYEAEASLLYKNNNVLKKLHNCIIKEKPTHIVAHSLGAALLFLYLSRYPLPQSLQKIVTVQADIPTDLTIQPTLINQLKLKHITWQNIYCFWDPALILSSIYHKKNRAGLIGIKNKQIQNKFIPLYSNTNLHTCTINNKRNISTFLETPAKYEKR